MYNVIELFAGAGGLSLGFEKAGFNHEMLVEIDKDCVSTLEANRPNWNIVHDDVSNIRYNDINADVVTGGFPCQAFSYAGKRRGFQDTRGTLFFEFARCVSDVRPKIAVAENVEGLIRHDNGKTLKTMIEVLEDLGYYVQYKVLNASHYGVAQKRKRLFLVATSSGYKFTYPQENSTIPTLKDALKDVPDSPGTTYSENKKKVLDLVPPGGCWVDLPEDIQKEYMKKSFYSSGGKRGMARRLSWDEPCLTLTTSPCQKQTERCHPAETRPFTIREYARIQSFPDDWRFTGSISSQYKQIGNAVPVKLATSVATEVKKALDNKSSEYKVEVQTKLEF